MDMKMVLFVQEMMKNDYGKIMVWLVLILLLMAIDIATGLIQAYINHDIKSGKMSTGLLKKFALFLVLIAIVPITIVLPTEVSVSVIISVYTFEMVNELISIVENLNKLGIATDVLSPLMKRLNATNKNEKEDDEK